MKKIVPGILMSVVLALSLEAVVPRKWELRTKEDFLRGKFDGVSLVVRRRARARPPGGPDRRAERGILPVAPRRARRRALPRDRARREDLQDRQGREGRALFPDPGDGRDLPGPRRQGGPLRRDVPERQDLQDHRQGKGRGILQSGREIRLGPGVHGLREPAGGGRGERRHLRDRSPGRGPTGPQSGGESHPLPEESRLGRHLRRERRGRVHLSAVPGRPGLRPLRIPLRGGPQPRPGQGGEHLRLGLGNAVEDPARTRPRPLRSKPTPRSSSPPRLRARPGWKRRPGRPRPARSRAPFTK